MCMTTAVATEQVAAVCTDTRYFEVDPETGETLLDSYEDRGGKLFELPYGWMVGTGNSRAVFHLARAARKHTSADFRALHSTLSRAFREFLADGAPPEPSCKVKVAAVEPFPKILASQHGQGGSEIQLAGPMRDQIHWPPYDEDRDALEDALAKRFRESITTDPTFTGVASALGRLFSSASEGTRGMSGEVEMGFVVATEPPYFHKWTGTPEEIADDTQAALYAQTGT